MVIDNFQNLDIFLEYIMSQFQHRESVYHELICLRQRQNASYQSNVFSKTGITKAKRQCLLNYLDSEAKLFFQLVASI